MNVNSTARALGGETAPQHHRSSTVFECLVLGTFFYSHFCIYAKPTFTIFISMPNPPSPSLYLCQTCLHHLESKGLIFVWSDHNTLAQLKFKVLLFVMKGEKKFISGIPSKLFVGMEVTGFGNIMTPRRYQTLHICSSVLD